MVVASAAGIAAAELVGVVASDVSARAPNPTSVFAVAVLTAGVAIGASRRPSRTAHQRARESSAAPNAIEDHGWEARDEGALVNAAVGSLGEALGRGDAGSAVPLAVHVGEELVEVFWDRPPPPITATFRASSTGWVWTTSPAQLAAEIPAEEAGSAEVLLPALVAAGATGLGDLYLNLEGFGLLNLVGDAEHALAAARHLLSAVTSPLVDVLVVGTPTDEPAARFGVGVEWVTLDGALVEVRRRRARLRRELEERAWTSVLTARLRDPAREQWRPLVVAVMDPDGDVETRDRIVRAARGSRSGATCVFVNRDPDDESAAVVCGDGVMHLPVLGGVAVVFDDGTDARAGPPADARGDDVDAVDADVSSVLAAAPAGGVEVRVLGPVAMAGACSQLGGKGLELVAYLACHPDGVSDERIKTVLWPSREVQHQSWLNRLSAARHALGVDDDGELLLPHLEDGISRVTRSLTTDVEAVEAALRTAQDVPDPGAIEVLREALGRVRGRPFEERAGYDWAFAEFHVAHAERIVTDAAHRLAELALGADDTQTARWAAEQGLVAVPVSEPLTRDRMRAFAAAGDVRGVRRALRDLLAGIASPEDPAVLSPETRALYEQLCAPSRLPVGWATAPAGGGSADRPADR